MYREWFYTHTFKIAFYRVTKRAKVGKKQLAIYSSFSHPAWQLPCLVGCMVLFMSSYHNTNIFSKKVLTNSTTHDIINIVEDIHAALAQLDRVFGYEPKGRGFESLTPCQLYLFTEVQFFIGV